VQPKSDIKTMQQNAAQESQKAKPNKPCTLKGTAKKGTYKQCSRKQREKKSIKAKCGIWALMHA
jgi:hypothetical protein